MMEAEQMKPKKVLVVEARQHVSCGATGRNGGHLWPRSKSELGDEEYFNFQEHCVRILRDKIKDIEEECEWAETGAVNVARFQDEIDDWDDFYDVSSDGVEMWNQQGIKKRIPQINEDNAIGGVFYKNCGQFYPQKFVHSLFNEAKDKVKFLFMTTVDSVEKNDSDFTLHVTQHANNEFHTGALTTKTLIHCTNAYVKNLPDYIQDSIIPFRGQVIITKPTDEKFGLIPHSLAFNDGFEYLIHRQKDRRIVFGGMRWVSESKEEHTIDDSDKHPEISEKLLENLCEWFPEANIEIETDWSGIMANTVDSKPIVGQLDSQNELIGVAFCGNGMPKSYGVGESLAHLAVNPLSREIPSCLKPDRFKGGTEGGGK
eukprot:CAMPEP_0117440638 /NCGR_PEP_ID=MMETSP0759-20121206/3201_1 /TAXON_ID=63605 /ORGANISM="Percolomonas cosmopolitus, Strain WS" /LENGTH=371 /DNA_ID=CAMNT_0005232425 /DNA_START=108 /DNA_END=1220 /DNA_ORIENTATION=-